MTDTEKSLQHQVDQLTLECDLLRKKCQQSDEAYAVLMDQLKQMLRHRFGQKSERYIDLENPQLSLYGEVILNEALDEDHEVSDDSCDNEFDRQKKRRAKKSRNTFAAHLPRTEQLIPVDAHDKTCQCGCQKKGD
jgi:transposase